MSCDGLLDEIQERLGTAETLLLRATPETVTASAAELSEALAGMTALMERMEAGRSDWTDVERDQLRASVGRAKWRLSRIARLVEQAGQFYQGWGRRLCEQAGYVLDGRAIPMPELVRSARPARQWEG